MNHFKAFISVLLVTFASTSIAGAGTRPIAPQSVPVLDTWGLIGISALLGILGILSLKRRK